MEARCLLAAITVTSVSDNMDVDGQTLFKTVSPADPVATPGAEFHFDINYETPGAATTGLVLRLHYDSSQLTFVGLDNIYDPGLDQWQDKTEDFPDGDDTTDRMLLIQWVDNASPPTWGTQSPRLFTASFLAAPQFTGTTIPVTGIASPGDSGFQAFDIDVAASTGLAITAPGGPTDNQRPTIVWSSVPDAISYDVYLELLQTGPNTPIINTNVTGTSYALTQDLGIGRYRAWVRARSSAGQSNWETGDFQINIGSELTELPFHGDDLTPTISWSAVPGAGSYRVYISNVTAGVVVVDTMVTGTSFTPAADLEFGRHQIWVRAIGPQDYPAAWSGVQKYYVGPDLLNPVTSTFNLQPQFSWTSLPGISSYQLFVQRGSTVVVNETGLLGNSFTPASPLALGDYRWWIRPFHANGTGGAWSELGEFSAGGSPKIVSPSGTISDSTPTVTWEPVDGAGSYEVYLFNDDGQGLIHRQSGITDTRFAHFPLTDGNYRVWVKSYKTDGESGRWSRAQGFEVNASTISTTVIPIRPVNPTFDTTPTFQWSAGTGGSRFDLYATDGTTVIEQRDLTTNLFTPSSELTAGPWRWWVRARNAAGAAGPWAESDTDTSGRPVVSTFLPASGAGAGIQWSRVDGAVRYELLVVHGSDTVVRDSALTDTSFQLPGSTPPGNYRAWVRAINGATNGLGPWSFELQVTVANNGPLS